MEWLIVVIAVAAVLAVVAVVMLQNKSASLKRRFGPEYDRLVDEEGDRRSAEARLRDRIKRREALEIRELGPDAAARFAERWREIQFNFVDEPDKSVAAADALLDEVARQRGYPVDEVDEHLAMLSVDHPRLVHDYRAAHAVQRRGEEESATIDELRIAFQQYRSLFDELLGNGAAHRQTPQQIR